VDVKTLYKTVIDTRKRLLFVTSNARRWWVIYFLLSNTNVTNVEHPRRELRVGVGVIADGTGKLI